MNHPPRIARTYELFVEMTTDSAARGRAVLSDALSGEAVEPWLSRLVLGSDGTFRLALEQPKMSKEALARHERFSTPSSALVLETETVTLPISQALALLKSPDSPEAEVERRRQAHNDMLELDRKNQQERAEEQARQHARDREWEEHREQDLHGSVFDGLPGWLKNDLALAVIFEEEGLPQIAARIRKLASTVLSKEPGGAVSLKKRRHSIRDVEGAWLDGPPLPDARWWP